MANATCGSGDSITLDGSNCFATQFSINFSSNEQDVRYFEETLAVPGGYGTWLACDEQGQISVTSYERPDYDPGDIVQVVASINGKSFDLQSVVTNQTVNVDAKDIVTFVTTLRVTEDNAE